MPQRSSLTSTFPVTDADNEVVCPLRNQDGSSCRKRCLGEKRYRSMQEHIRRAHPEYYIPKLPATKDSFDLMVNSPPQERPPPQSSSPLRQQHPQPLHRYAQHSDASGYGHSLTQHDTSFYGQDSEATAIYNSMQAQARSSDEYRRGSLIPAASAAQALAQLHYHRGPDPDSDYISQTLYSQDANDLKNHHPFDQGLDEPNFMQDPTSYPNPATQNQSLLPSSLNRSPVERHHLPHLQRSLSKQHNRPRKSSLSQQARMAKHERKKSKEQAKRISGDKKALLSEHNVAAFGKRWEDLLDAATSATEEEGSRDLTPIPASPYQSPQANPRTSLPPFALGSQFQSFQASPLNRALTPPAADANLDLQPFPSVESSLSSHQHNNSAGSGSQFQIMNPASMDSSPIFGNTNDNSHHPSMSEQVVQIYCAGCKKLNSLAESYACTNCICGLCHGCVEALVENQRTGRMSGCPRCQLNYGTFKPFNLDLR